MTTPGNILRNLLTLSILLPLVISVIPPSLAEAAPGDVLGDDVFPAPGVLADFGDAPDSWDAPGYPTLAANNGARHVTDGEVYLGQWVEGDSDGQPSAGAIGDDIGDATDDEDGVVIPPLMAGSTSTIGVTASIEGFLNAWIDFNADGDWDDPGEQVLADRLIPAGSSTHEVHVLADATPGSSYARFRFGTQSGLSYDGAAPDGEVEDYEITIRPFGPDHFEPNDSFDTAVDLGHSDQHRVGLGMHEAGDEDWFQWTALHDGPVTFEVNSASGSGEPAFELYDAQGGLVTASEPDGDTASVLVDALAGQSYRVRVLNLAPIGSEYELSVETGAADADNYAVLFSGGINKELNHDYYYYNIKEMYEILVYNYGLDPLNVWVLFADGTNPAVDRSDGVSSDMTYASAAHVMRADRAHLEPLLTTTLADEVDANDHFLFYAFDHGGGAKFNPDIFDDEVLSGWISTIFDHDLADWLNLVGAGYTTVMHTQCFAGGMIDNLIPLSPTAFAAAATNHYEFSYADGFAGAFAHALDMGIHSSYDAYLYTHDHDPYAYPLGTYPPNGGDVFEGREHPWAISETNFPIFADAANSPPLMIRGMITLEVLDPVGPVIITYDQLLASTGGWDPDPDKTYFRIESVEVGSLAKAGVPIVAGQTTLRYGESLEWTPPAAAFAINPLSNSVEDAPGPPSILDAFTVRLWDGATISDDSAGVRLSLGPSGTAVAEDDAVELDEDGPVTIAVLSNDSGEGALVVQNVGEARRGTVSLVQGQVVYTPGPNFHGTDQFTYGMIDSSESTDTAAVSVTVRSVNDPPEAHDDHFSVLMNSTDNLMDALSNDYDVDPDPLSAVLGTLPLRGIVVQNPEGAFSYTPDPGYTGPDSFTYFADDGQDTAEATVWIMVLEEGNLDWGDAPELRLTEGAGYPTRAGSGGASHMIQGPWLGAEPPDAEADGQPQANALGDDDNSSDDEEGVSIPVLRPGKSAELEVQVGGGGGYLDAWIDWNGNRHWGEPEEEIFSGYLPDGVHVLAIEVPEIAVLGETFARFRISSQGDLSPTGPAEEGEVEDHAVYIEFPEVCHVDEDADVDWWDIWAIFRARGTSASGPDDPRDYDNNGIITINDARSCVLLCDLPSCIPPTKPCCRCRLQHRRARRICGGN